MITTLFLILDEDFFELIHNTLKKGNRDKKFQLCQIRLVPIAQKSLLKINNNFFKKRHNPPALMQIFHYYHNYIELPKKAIYQYYYRKSGLFTP